MHTRPAAPRPPTHGAAPVVLGTLILSKGHDVSMSLFCAFQACGASIFSPFFNAKSTCEPPSWGNGAASPRTRDPPTSGEDKRTRTIVKKKENEEWEPGHAAALSGPSLFGLPLPLSVQRWRPTFAHCSPDIVACASSTGLLLPAPCPACSVRPFPRHSFRRRLRQKAAADRRAPSGASRGLPV